MRKTAKKPTTRNAAGRGARHAEIARALVVDQKPPVQIAREFGVSRAAIHHQIYHPETQALIRGWMEPHHAAIQRMIPKALAAVDSGLKPNQETRDRLHAVKTLGAVLGWAEGRTDGNSNSNEPKRFSGTLEELLMLYHTIRAASAPLASPAVPDPPAALPPGRP